MKILYTQPVSEVISIKPGSDILTGSTNLEFVSGSNLGDPTSESGTFDDLFE